MIDGKRVFWRIVAILATIIAGILFLHAVNVLFGGVGVGVVVFAWLTVASLAVLFDGDSE